jgi:hypothetical protein
MRAETKKKKKEKLGIDSSRIEKEGNHKLMRSVGERNRLVVL